MMGFGEQNHIFVTYVVKPAFDNPSRGVASFMKDAELLAPLLVLSLPVVGPFVMGLDGTSYYLTIRNGFNETTLRWWGILPDEWRALEPIIAELETRLEVVNQWAEPNQETR